MGYQNFYAAKLASDIGASDTSITVDAAPTITEGRMVIEARNATNREIIKFTGRSGTTLTGVLRGQGGTTAKPHLKNALIENNATAEDFEDLYTAFNDFEQDTNDWRPLVNVPTVTSNDGGRLHELTYTGEDLTGVIQSGTKLRIPRTGTTPTQSADFNGTTQYASKSSPTGITFTDDFTIEAWVELDSYASAGAAAIVSRVNGASGFMLFVNNNGTICLTGYNSGLINRRRVVSDTSIPLNKKVHIACSLNMSAGDTSDSKILIDGINVSRDFETSGTNPTSLVQAGNLQIGSGDGTTYPLNGRVSEARIWNTIRTEAQIRDNMNQQLTGSETGLVGYWKLNGDFNDSTANANHLTANAGAVATYADHPFSAIEYAEVQSIAFSSDTTVQVYSGINSVIPNETLGATSYSGAAVPIGVPSDLASTPRSGRFAIGVIAGSTLGTTGNKAITGVGFTPKLLRFRTQVLDGEAATTALYWAEGSATPTSQMFTAVYSSTSSVRRVGSQSYCIGWTNNTTSMFLASLVSMDSDGFTINVSTASTGFSIMYEAYG